MSYRKVKNAVVSVQATECDDNLFITFVVELDEKIFKNDICTDRKFKIPHKDTRNLADTVILMQDREGTVMSYTVQVANDEVIDLEHKIMPEIFAERIEQRLKYNEPKENIVESKHTWEGSILSCVEHERVRIVPYPFDEKKPISMVIARLINIIRNHPDRGKLILR